MLECHSCLIRCLRAIAGESLTVITPSARAGLILGQRTRSAPSLRSRGYTTDAIPSRHRSDFHRPDRDGGFQQGSGRESYQKYKSTDGYDRPRSRDYDKARNPREYQPEFASHSHSKDSNRLALNKRRKAESDVNGGSGNTEETDFASSMSPQLERAVKKELAYLKDPLKHANHVRQTLRANEIDKALALCRIASKEMQVIVSWNHTIDWLLARRELKSALKVYNEMKKRAQFPDSHTYVILLRGLAVAPVHPETVGKAVSIYHSLAAPNSRVVQGIIHTNAALKVCARGHDMDSLWGIASRIPDKGPGAGDNFTFTTILNAIRETALLRCGPREDEDAMAQVKQTAIGEGRRIWEDVIGKWRKGDLLVDEELVCAMGRILLLGLRPRDWDDVLSLVEQTMDIPRLAAKLGTPTRKAEHLPMPRVLKEDAEPNPDEDEVYGEFDKELVRPNKRLGNSSVAYVKPSQNTLSLVMEACLKMAAPKIANDYWDLLTASDSYGVVPDMDNLNMYLRLLRQSRSSTRAVEVLREDILAKKIRPQRKTYRIAMSACVRDKNNQHAVTNASAILDMMQDNRSELDVKAVQMYLDLCLGTTDGKTITQTLHRLAPLVQNLRSQISFGSDGGSAMGEAIKEEAMHLFRTIIGAIDQIMNKGLVPSEENVAWTQRRAKLAAFVTRANTKAQGKPISGKSGLWDEDKKREMRKESRQLRHLRQHNVKREKKAAGTFVDRRVSRPFGDTPGDLESV